MIIGKQEVKMKAINKTHQYLNVLIIKYGKVVFILYFQKSKKMKFKKK